MAKARTKNWLKFIAFLIGCLDALVNADATFSCADITYIRPDQNEKSWSEAQNVCRNFNATLPIADTPVHQSCFVSALKNFGADKAYSWMGANSSGGDPNAWRWLDGSAYSGAGTPLDWSFKFSYAYVARNGTSDPVFYSSDPTIGRPYICLYQASDRTNCISGSAQTAYVKDFNCFVQYNKTLSWFAARNSCLSNSGDLASFPTISLLKEVIGPGIWWVGLRSIWWSWVDTVTGAKKDVTYTQWSSDQPNGDYPQCISTDATDPSSNDFFNWRDYSCSDQQIFICQMSSSSSPPGSLSSSSSSSSSPLLQPSSSSSPSSPPSLPSSSQTRKTTPFISATVSLSSSSLSPQMPSQQPSSASLSSSSISSTQTRRQTASSLSSSSSISTPSPPISSSSSPFPSSSLSSSSSSSSSPSSSTSLPSSSTSLSSKPSSLSSTSLPSSSSSKSTFSSSSTSLPSSSSSSSSSLPPPPPSKGVTWFGTDMSSSVKSTTFPTSVAGPAKAELSSSDGSRANERIALGVGIGLPFGFALVSIIAVVYRYYLARFPLVKPAPKRPRAPASDADPLHPTSDAEYAGISNSLDDDPSNSTSDYGTSASRNPPPEYATIDVVADDPPQADSDSIREHIF